MTAKASLRISFDLHTVKHEKAAKMKNIKKAARYKEQDGKDI